MQQRLSGRYAERSQLHTPTGLVHGDLSVGNILVSHQGEVRFYITDWGGSYHVDKPQAERVTGTTYCVASPEQIGRFGQEKEGDKARFATCRSPTDLTTCGHWGVRYCSSRRGACRSTFARRHPVISARSFNTVNFGPRPRLLASRPAGEKSCSATQICQAAAEPLPHAVPEFLLAMRTCLQRLPECHPRPRTCSQC